MYKPDILTPSKYLHIAGIGDIVYSGNAIVVGPKGSGKTDFVKALVASNKCRFEFGAVILTDCRAYSEENYAYRDNVHVLNDEPTDQLLRSLIWDDKPPVRCAAANDSLTKPRHYSRMFIVDYSDSRAVSFPPHQNISTITVITADDSTLVKFSGARSLAASEHGALLIHVTPGSVLVYQRGTDLEPVLIAMAERLPTQSTALVPVAQMPTITAVQQPNTLTLNKVQDRVIWERVHPTVGRPTYGTAEAACFDMEAAIDEAMTIQAGKMAVIPLGWKVQLLPNTEMQLRGRSGLGIKHQITVVQGIGTIDEDYRGELMVGLINHSDTAFQVTPGMRVVQCKIEPTYRFPWTEGKVDTTERGEGKFGSTGLTSSSLDQMYESVTHEARKHVKSMLDTICSSDIHQSAEPVSRTVEEIMVDSSSLTAEEIEEQKVKALSDRLTAAFSSAISSITADEVNNAYQCDVVNIEDVKASLMRGVMKAIKTTLSTPPHLLKRFESVVQTNPLPSCAVAQGVVDRLKDMRAPYLFGAPVKVLTEDGWKTAGELKVEDRIATGDGLVPVGVSIGKLEEEAWQRPQIDSSSALPGSEPCLIAAGRSLLSDLCGLSLPGDAEVARSIVRGELHGEHDHGGISQPSGQKEEGVYGYDYNISEPVPVSVTPGPDELIGLIHESNRQIFGSDAIPERIDDSTLPTTGLYGERMGMKISEGSGIVVGVPLPDGSEVGPCLSGPVDPNTSK